MMIKEYAVDYSDHVLVVSVRVKDEDEWEQWQSGVAKIKKHIQSINEGYPQYCHNKMYPKWLDRVEKFRSRWGDERVPMDVMNAVHSVQEGMGIEKTIFKPVKGAVDYMRVVKKM